MIGTWYLLPMILGPVVGVIGTVFGAFLTMKAQRRTTAGTVETSNAAELWAENSRIVERLSKEVERLERDVMELRNEVRELRTERDQAWIERDKTKVRLHEMEMELTRLRAGQAIQAAQTVAAAKLSEAADAQLP